MSTNENIVEVEFTRIKIRAAVVSEVVSGVGGGATGGGTSGGPRPRLLAPHLDSTVDGNNRNYGVYSLFPNNIGARPTTYHKVSESVFSSLNTFGAPTPPPGSPYSLDLLTKSVQSQHLYVDTSSCKLEDFKKQLVDSPTAVTSSVMQPFTGRPGGSGKDDYSPNKRLASFTKDVSYKRFATMEHPGRHLPPFLNPVQGPSGLQVQVKREPVIEVSAQGIKMEQSSPRDHHPITSSHSSIPVGIAVARQRLAGDGNGGMLGMPGLHQQHTKDFTRQQDATSDCFASAMGMGVAQPGMGGPVMQPCGGEERGGWGMAPSSSAAPTFWQYPAAPGVAMEPMLLNNSINNPGGLPPGLTSGPGGYQIVKDPNTGTLLVIAEAPTVVWGPPPAAPQPLMLPPPPLQLLSGELHTLHHHTTRLLTLAPAPPPAPPVPIPTQERRPKQIPLHALIKIEPEPERTVPQQQPIYTHEPTLATHVFYPAQQNYLQITQQQQPTEVTNGPLVQQVCRSQATSPVMSLTPPPEEVPAQRDASNQTDSQPDDDYNFTSNSADENFPACVGVSSSYENCPSSAHDNLASTRDAGTVDRPIPESEINTVDLEHENPPPINLPDEPSVDLSGLELLSNSIEQFEINIKPSIEQSSQNTAISKDDTKAGTSTIDSHQVSFKQESKPRAFDGLGLLSAIAEQRFMEEVEEVKENKIKIPSDLSNASTVSKSSYEKDISSSKFEKIRRRNEERHSSDDPLMQNDQQKENRKDYDEKRAKEKKKNKSRKKNKERRRKHRSRRERRDKSRSSSDTSEPSGALMESYKRVAYCKCGNGGCKHVPSAKELVDAIEKDMRAKLEQLERACDERKRQLDELEPLPPHVSSEEPSPGCSKKRKVGRPRKVLSSESTETMAEKTPKTKPPINSLAGLLTVNEGASTSRVRPKLKAEIIVKHISEDEEDTVVPSHAAVSESAIENPVKEKEHPMVTPKNTKQHKKRRCTLTEEYLDKSPRVLTEMGGLFYAGKLSAIQAPDIYAVNLDGERNNKPHILSREDMLRDTILEVRPANAAELTPGTRMCAYWSQQYRCLYPGTVVESSDTDEHFVPVEFDDGDSGRIAIGDIRFLEPDYPVVENKPVRSVHPVPWVADVCQGYQPPETGNVATTSQLTPAPRRAKWSRCMLRSSSTSSSDSISSDVSDSD